MAEFAVLRLEQRDELWCRGICLRSKTCWSRDQCLQVLLLPVSVCPHLTIIQQGYETQQETVHLQTVNLARQSGQLNERCVGND